MLFRSHDNGTRVRFIEDQNSEDGYRKLSKDEELDILQQEFEEFTESRFGKKQQEAAEMVNKQMEELQKVLERSGKSSIRQRAYQTEKIPEDFLEIVALNPLDSSAALPPTRFAWAAVRIVRRTKYAFFTGRSSDSASSPAPLLDLSINGKWLRLHLTAAVLSETCTPFPILLIARLVPVCRRSGTCEYPCILLYFTV